MSSARGDVRVLRVVSLRRPALATEIGRRQDWVRRELIELRIDLLMVAC